MLRGQTRIWKPISVRTACILQPTRSCCVCSGTSACASGVHAAEQRFTAARSKSKYQRQDLQGVSAWLHAQGAVRCATAGIQDVYVFWDLDNMHCAQHTYPQYIQVSMLHRQCSMEEAIRIMDRSSQESAAIYAKCTQFAQQCVCQCTYNITASAVHCRRCCWNAGCQRLCIGPLPAIPQHMPNAL
jgi:hypothetical protein